MPPKEFYAPRSWPPGCANRGGWRPGRLFHEYPHEYAHSPLRRLPAPRRHLDHPTLPNNTPMPPSPPSRPPAATWTTALGEKRPRNGRTRYIISLAAGIIGGRIE